MERPLSSVMIAEAYGTFLLVFIGATSITIANDAALFPAGPSLGLGFVGLAFGLALVAAVAAVVELALVGASAASLPGVFLGSNLPNTSLPMPIFAAVLAEVVGTTI